MHTYCCSACEPCCLSGFSTCTVYPMCEFRITALKWLQSAWGGNGIAYICKQVIEQANTLAANKLVDSEADACVRNWAHPCPDGTELIHVLLRTEHVQISFVKGGWFLGLRALHLNPMVAPVSGCNRFPSPLCWQSQISQKIAKLRLVEHFECI